MVTKNQIEPSNNLKRNQPPIEDASAIDAKKPKQDKAQPSTMKMTLRSASKIQNTENKDSKKMKRKYERKFNFPTLPYVCQRRFAEICDPQTLKTFASINFETRKLSRHFHIVDKAAVFLFPYTFRIHFSAKCFCAQNEYCNKDSRTLLAPIKAKIETLNEIQITSLVKHSISSQMMDNLPINFDGVKKISFHHAKMNLNDLKKFIKPGLKELNFISGGFPSPCNIKDFINFLNDLSTKLDDFLFDLDHSIDSFNFNALDSPNSSLNKKSVIVFHQTNETRIFKI